MLGIFGTALWEKQEQLFRNELHLRKHAARMLRKLGTACQEMWEQNVSKDITQRENLEKIVKLWEKQRDCWLL